METLIDHIQVWAGEKKHDATQKSPGISLINKVHPNKIWHQKALKLKPPIKALYCINMSSLIPMKTNSSY